MHNFRRLRRSLLLTVSLLSACAVSDLIASGAQANSAPQQPTGVYGAYLAGRFAEKQDDLGYAALELLEANRSDPDNVDIRKQAFIACVLDGRPEAAGLAAQLPNDPAALLFLADQDAAAGRWDQAEQRFRSLPNTGLTQLVRPLLIAWAQQGGGHTDAALATLQPLVEGENVRGVFALHSALIADLAGRDTDAARLYRIAQQEYGGINVRLAQILASWQARQGDTDAAKQTLESVTLAGQTLDIILPGLMAQMTTRPVMSPTDGIAEAYLALAGSLHQQESPGFTLFLLRLALDLRPSFTAARLLVADALEGAQHPANALEALLPVPDNDPLFGLVELRRAALEQRLGNTDEAIRLLEQLASQNPKSTEPLVQIGDILRAAGRFTDAVKAYDRAIARIGQPSRADWSLFYSRAIAYDRAHEWDKAEADLKHALQLSPDEPYVLNYLGYSWTEQGRNLEQAKQMIDKAAELRPNDGAILDSLGWVLLRLGNPTEAIRWLEQAVEIESQDATINGHLGDAYWAAGRKLQAQFQWRRALTMNPEPDDAAKLQAKLRDAATSVGKPTAAAASPVQ
jgi:tetratricopeptide (TPR) repeat protein